MKIVSAAEMREIDRVTSQRFGVPSLTLMEKAGAAVANFVLAHYADARNIVVLCGKGNNGGDGFVVARRLLEQGRSLRVILLAKPEDLSGDAAAMFGKLTAPVRAVQSKEDFAEINLDGEQQVDLFIDAILGTGFKPPVSGLYAEAITFINASRVPVVAVDIPSGADADAITPQQGSIARADAIVTFTAPRPAHIFGALTIGPTIVADIGSPQEAIASELRLNVITAGDVAPLIGPRKEESNKGNYGHVLVVGGALGKSGSVAMSGMSALRVGAGLSTVATARSALQTVASFHPELMTEPLPETNGGTIAGNALKQIEKLAKGKSVLAIGPGISQHTETAKLVREIVSSFELPIVLDADGLNAFVGFTNQLSGKTRTLVITPHPGEMARLAGMSIPEVQKNRLEVARQFSREHSLIVVLKGHRTLVVHPDGDAWVNTTGNPGMSTGGTGDVLTGMVAGMIAQNKDNVFAAVCAAVHLHGLAGDLMRETVGEHSLVATDLLIGLPEAFRRTRKVAQDNFVRWN